MLACLGVFKIAWHLPFSWRRGVWTPLVDQNQVIEPLNAADTLQSINNECRDVLKSLRFVRVMFVDLATLLVESMEITPYHPPSDRHKFN